jgi:formate dehydrogenase maturation protein FdhE
MESTAMFSVATEVAAGRVGVTTSDNGGLTNAQISEMAINKIISISENTPEPLKQQVHVFADNVRNVLHYYIELAKKEERATICHQLREAGHKDLAETIRRI